MTPGVFLADGATRFSVRSPRAEALTLCLFEDEAEQRIAMTRVGDNWIVEIPRDLRGIRYGYRASGEWNPPDGLWFDPAKLLVDPYAIELDGSFVQHTSLSTYGADTSKIVPKAVVTAPPVISHLSPLFRHGGLIYEVNVRGLTMLHPDVPQPLRGTVAALAHPAIIGHLKQLHVSAVELMPIVAWIDERHLPPLGLTNAWGYNPVAPMALDPRVCPGGVRELRETVATLRAEGIGVILDIVLNHSGESDVLGPVLCLRGLDDAAYTKAPDGRLINDTGCGNTLDFGNPAVRALALDTLRHFTRHCGVDGFRFDLAPILARSPGFAADAPIFREIAADPVLADRVMIAEPWDIGPGGYQLGGFPSNWLEWNDRFRDDVRRFWKGETGVGALATRIAGSSDIFGKACRTVNFLAAHDGFTLADTLAYEQRHNWANGEENRDGHGENFSWNNGMEGETDNLDVLSRRAALVRAMLGTLFISTGTILLTAGDEFGRSQRGNNNAYAQDNEITWIDWDRRDRALEAWTFGLSAWRHLRISSFTRFPEDGTWRDLNGTELHTSAWESDLTQGFFWQNGSYGFVVDRTAPMAGPV
ncbi:Isoamylase [Novosphingobium aromaticivorans DSM 12444]|uniref:Isoamylase n=1 Tax=Novosphingobium aromaticivorans (strain ATCC 700278 / DSM 12444 / CCUG 56034 / CIP 105152 / NBRC 16084 / F199) TaxID=279238 RepID=Q2G7S9_NOVAD|nr:glycogen debranching protein GlgX [Novosphingobium aromaticivorans]ABD26094.1 Isoamylase [Novosphingobium aromaticivorans DSM 12444]SCY59601.1 glycogen operon protein [Novosphingobium aromaticivorans]